MPSRPGSAPLPGPLAVLVPALLALAMLAGAGHTQTPPGERDFADILARCRGLMERGEWPIARRTLKALLAEHGPQPYVRARKHELLADLERCAFQCMVPAVDPATLVGGELLHLDRRTGQIRLRYRKGQTADFARQRLDDGGELLVHPLVFTGERAVTIRGDRYPAVAPFPRAVLCADDGEALDFCWGVEGAARNLPLLVRRLGGGREQPLFQRDHAGIAAGQPFALQISGDGQLVQMAANGAVLASVPADAAPGRIAVVANGFDELVLEGRSDLAWLRAVEDRARRAAWEHFERRYEPARDVPAWLLEPDAAPAGESRALRSWPGELGRAHLACAEIATRHLNAGNHEQCLQFVEGTPVADLPPPARDWLAGMALVKLERFREAVACLDRVVDADPRFTEGRACRAAALYQLRRFGEAERDYRSVLQDDPGHADAATGLVELLLNAGHPAAAKAVADAAAAQAVHGERFAALQRLLAKAQRGPNWARVHEYRSRHYRVMTDLDEAAAARVAETLEAAWTAYGRALGVGRPAAEPLRVYLFAGAAGYTAYVDGILGQPALRSNGIYSSTLKQLVVCNTGDLGALLATVRHEGFHQYLDGIARDPPVWFDEGLAEYFESGTHAGGWFTAAAVRRDHVERLLAGERLALRAFLHLSRSDFYRDAEANYAMAWAFVHFLRHGREAPADLFARQFAACAQQVDARAAVAQGFAGVDLEVLDGAFWRHVQRLAAGARSR
jgi:Flp pilus assembly protein TadD